MAANEQQPLLPSDPTIDDCKRHIRELVRWVGPGFHPDTDFHDYVIADTGRRSYDPADADALNADLDRAVELLDAAAIDPCAIGLPVQRRLLRAMGAQ
jgi:hypothetical protein